MANVISASKLTLAYDGGRKEIIKNASFNIRKGEFVFITGPSGSGKSTLLKALYGALRPKEGVLRVGGLDMNASAGASSRSCAPTWGSSSRITSSSTSGPWRKTWYCP